MRIQAFSFIYQLAWQAALPFLQRHKRLQEGVEQRMVPPTWGCVPAWNNAQPAPTIWVQAASGGEAWLVHSLVAALTAQAKLADAPLRLFCTTWTRQGMDVLKQLPENTPYITVHSQYFPFDAPKLMQQAIQQLKPQVLVLLETELWPGLMWACHQHKIPVLVLNGRITPKSMSAYTWLRPLWRKVFPQHILATSPADAQRFATLFQHSTVATMSNMKFDRLNLHSDTPVSTQAKSPQPGATAPPLSIQAPCIALASVRQEEEQSLQAILPQLCTFQLAGYVPVVAVAPRHMHRVAHWEAWLQEAGIPYALRSQHAKGQASLPAQGVLLWDSFGELDRLYALADCVFVGGSLAPLGGQNFLEPLQAGKYTYIGTSWENFSWVGTTLMQQELVHSSPNATALAHALTQRLHTLLGDVATHWEEKRQHSKHDVQQRFATWVAPHQGGSEQAAQAIMQTLYPHKT